VTGLSGCGKSTFARLLKSALRRVNADPLVFDGDELRQYIAGPRTKESSPFGSSGSTSFTMESRRELAFQYAELAHLSACAGHDVICATVSAFEDVREANRRLLPDYTEIWIDAPMDLLRARDPHGYYARAFSGEIRNMVGVDLAFTPPARPDHVVRNDSTRAALARTAGHVAAEWSTRRRNLQSLPTESKQAAFHPESSRGASCRR
jgi:adenylylsulfate kinase-like enzyme